MLQEFAYIFISPLNQSAFFCCIGSLLLIFTKFPRWLGKMLIFGGIAWLTLCSQYFFSHLLIAPLEKQFPPIKIQSQEWQKANAMWVLACYHFDAEHLPTVSQLNHCSLERLVQAANMYRINPLPIYLTGGNFAGNGNKNHTDIAAKLLIELGVKKQDIKHVPIGANTLQEAVALSQLLARQKLAVISSATHGLRLSKILEKLKIEFTFIPVHFATNGNNNFALNSPSAFSLLRTERAMYEYAALVKYWFKE